jgi:hypothetical protein
MYRLVYEILQVLLGSTIFQLAEIIICMKEKS